MPDYVDGDWTGCGRTLPHEGTGWRESSRCRLFQRIAERAWDEGRDSGAYWSSSRGRPVDPRVTPPASANPFRVISPAPPTPECERTASCEPGDHTYSWPCVHAPTSPASRAEADR